MTDVQRRGRVHVANALANCEPPQTSLVKQPREGERDTEQKREEEEGSGWCSGGGGVVPN